MATGAFKPVWRLVMAWTEQQANAYISGKSYDEVEGMNGTSQPNIQETESVASNVEPATAEQTTTAEPQNETPVKEEKSTSPVTEEGPEKAESVEQVTPKKVPTHDEKVAHSFAKMNRKNKDLQTKNESLLKEIETLKADLEKYKGLTENDFGGNKEQYDDYRFNQRWNNAMVERLQKEVDENENLIRSEENAEIAQERLMACFPDEVERGKYLMLANDAEQNFGLKHPEYGFKSFSEFLMSEEDKTVLAYLQDSDNSPKLIRHFINKPDVVDKIMKMRSPINKVVALNNLESRMIQMEKVRAAKETVPTKPLAPVKKELPDTGKIIQNANINEGFDFSKPMSEKDAIRYFQSQGRL